MNQAKTKVKEVLKNEFAQSVIKLFETPFIPIKILLASFVIVTSILSAFLTIQSIMSYFDYEVITNIRTLYETSVVFPKITICNSSPFTTEASVDFLKKINKFNYPNIDIFDRFQMRKLTSKEKHNIYKNISLIALAEISSRNFDNNRRLNLTHSLDDILHSCVFNKNPCSVNDFVTHLVKRVGICHTFNSGINRHNESVQLKTLPLSGEAHKFQMEFYVNFHQNLSEFNSYTRALGAFIRIENSSYLSEASDWIQIQPGQRTHISIERTLKFFMPKPYSRCDIDNESPGAFDSYLYNFIGHSSYQYSQQFCLTQCYQRELIKECGCSDSLSVSLFNADDCSSDSICMEKFYTKFYYSNSNTTTDFLEICLPECPLECNLTQYKISIVSSSYLVGDRYLDLIRENEKLSVDFKSLDLNKARESFVRIGIYLDSLAYSLSTETSKMDVVSLLADIGGNLGLFLGVSLFSLCELVELFLEIFYLNIRNSRYFSKKINNPETS